MKGLRRCPCGRIPSDLVVTPKASHPDLAFVAGNCCGKWAVEVEFKREEKVDIYTLAAAAWNDAPRGAIRKASYLGVGGGILGCWAISLLLPPGEFPLLPILTGLFLAVWMESSREK